MAGTPKRDESFGPSRRIKKRQDFLRLQAGGYKSRSAHLLLISTRLTDPELSSGDSRLGVTITTKVDKRSVGRNRLRRRLRELFRRERESFRAPFDIVVVALTGATKLEFLEVEAEFLTLLRRAKILPSN